MTTEQVDPGGVPSEPLPATEPAAPVTDVPDDGDGDAGDGDGEGDE